MIHNEIFVINIFGVNFHKLILNFESFKNHLDTSDKWQACLAINSLNLSTIFALKNHLNSLPLSLKKASLSNPWKWSINYHKSIDHSSNNHHSDKDYFLQ